MWQPWRSEVITDSFFLCSRRRENGEQVCVEMGFAAVALRYAFPVTVYAQNCATDSRGRSVTMQPMGMPSRSLKAAITGLVASLQNYGAAVLGDYQAPGSAKGGNNSEMLELLSALYNGEMRPVRRPSPETDIGHMLSYRRASFGLDAMGCDPEGGKMGQV